MLDKMRCLSLSIPWVAVCLLATAPTSSVATAAAEPQGQPQGPAVEFEIEHLSWFGEAAEGDTVAVSNPFGDVRARFGGYECQVEIFATAQQFPAEGPALEIEARPADDGPGVEIEVGYRDRDEDRNGSGDTAGRWVTVPTEGQKRRVDLVVFVPHGASLRATTRDGLFQAKGLHGDVRANTAGGDLYARGVQGDLDLSSESGDVLVVLGYRDTARRQNFSSQAGDVTLYANEETHLAVDLETAGRISTDFTMAIETDRKTGTQPATQHGSARLGKGSTPVRLHSETGHLRLVRLPLAQEARALVPPTRPQQTMPQPTMPPTETESIETESGPSCRVVFESDRAPVTVASVNDGPPRLQGNGASSVTEETTDEAVTRFRATGDDPLDLLLPIGCELSAQTVTGDMVYLFAAPASSAGESEDGATIQLATSGEITVDVSVDIETRPHQEPSKLGFVKIADGRTPIQLTSRRGSISVLQAD